VILWYARPPDKIVLDKFLLTIDILSILCYAIYLGDGKDLLHLKKALEKFI